ncbi:DMT family transporter [Halioglobus maricola]|uniref:DMT family transporter n=1 Tax=Halioglobus maricola TaxID=2601894 RepID=A0A5P9NKZ5_9GAMM|nr:DMT family transporter [Halioglobus maricola]QFU75618.1 DMT family transporter [Halioglobus maricola]
MSRPILHPGIPFAAACLGMATFAGMDALMKGLSIEMGVYNALLWRTGIAAGLALLLFLIRRSALPGSKALRIHVWRGIITSVMAYLFFWGLVYVPLAEAIALSFIAPLIALYLAAILLGEKINRNTIMASVLGLAGAGIIIQGKLSGEYSSEVGKGVAAILISAALYAYNLILQRQQALIANPVEISLFQNATVVGIYLLFAPFLAVVPALEQWPTLTLTAALGVLSLLCLSWAYGKAEAKTLIPVEYTAFIWASLFGWLMYGEKLTLITLAGTALIVIGCLLAARQHPDDVEHVESTAV